MKQGPYHYGTRSQVRMETQNNMQQISDMAAQQAAARDYKVSPQGPLVGEKTSSEIITKEYAKAHPVFVAKTVTLPQTYSQIRSIRGDGNCGWRAIAFAYFESLVNAGDRSRIEQELTRLTSLNNLIAQHGYPMDLFIDMVDETFELLKELAVHANNRPAAMASLMRRFSHENLDNAIIYHMRLLAATTMRSQPAAYEAFIPNGDGVEGFLKSTIQLPNQEIEQIGINLLVKVLLEPAGLALEIAYLDLAPGNDVNVYVFPEDANSRDLTKICLLFRPDHYDIVYRQNPRPDPMHVQVHHAVDYASHEPLGHVPMSPQYTIDPTLVGIFTGFGSSLTAGVSPIASVPSPQPPPLSNAYPPAASSSSWGKIAPFSDCMHTGATTRQLSPTDAHMMVPGPVESEHPVRLSKYVYEGMAQDTAYSSEPQFHSPAFKNSHHNKAHYANPDFQPEEYNPTDDPPDRLNHRKRSC